MNKIEFQTKLSKMCPWVDQTTFDLLEKYKLFVQQENQKYNLTRLVEEDKVYQNYFLESLIPYLKIGVFQPDSEFKVLDIGSGSGIPGVVLKIIFPNLKVTLLDSNSKKTEFLSKLISELQLSNVNVVYARAEEFVKDRYETFDVVTSRAVSSLYKILELSSGYCKIGGLIIQPKSLKAQEELAEAQGTIQTLNLELDKTQAYDFFDHQHVVFVFKKLKETDRKYPRTWQQILKKPL